VHVKGRLTSTEYVAVSVVSSGGYKRPARGRRADVEALLAWHTSKHTLLALVGYDGQLAADNDNAGQPQRHTARRIEPLAACADYVWRLGMCCVYASNLTNLYSVHSDRVRNWSRRAGVQLAP
jgi:hypothetical protein